MPNPSWWGSLGSLPAPYRPLDLIPQAHRPALHDAPPSVGVGRCAGLRTGGHVPEDLFRSRPHALRRGRRELCDPTAGPVVELRGVDLARALLTGQQGQCRAGRPVVGAGDHEAGAAGQKPARGLPGSGHVKQREGVGVAPPGQGDQDPSARSDLVQPRERDVPDRAGGDEAVVLPAVRVAAQSVTDDQPGRETGSLERRRRSPTHHRVVLDAGEIGVPEAVRAEGGRVTGSGADLKHPVSGLGAQLLPHAEHQRREGGRRRRVAGHGPLGHVVGPGPAVELSDQGFVGVDPLQPSGLALSDGAVGGRKAARHRHEIGACEQLAGHRPGGGAPLGFRENAVLGEPVHQGGAEFRCCAAHASGPFSSWSAMAWAIASMISGGCHAH